MYRVPLHHTYKWTGVKTRNGMDAQQRERERRERHTDTDRHSKQPHLVLRMYCTVHTHRQRLVFPPRRGPRLASWPVFCLISLARHIRVTSSPSGAPSSTQSRWSRFCPGSWTRRAIPQWASLGEMTVCPPAGHVTFRLDSLEVKSNHQLTGVPAKH